MIKLSGPSITARELSYVADAVANDWQDRAGEYQARFEKAFSAFAGTRHALATSSCTAAIHLALSALRIGPGDEVIVPELTWIATAAPVVYLGATVVFADVDLHTWCMAPDSVSALLGPRTRAIIPVDLLGGVADFGALRTRLDSNAVAVVEDAAQAVGSQRDGKPAGSFGDIGVYSFHGSKTMTTGEGGMLVTNRDDIFERAVFLNNHGRRGREQFNYEIGMKYKMSAMQAAMGLAQLERIDELVAGKRRVFQWYREELGDIPSIALNAEPAGVLSTYWLVTIVARDGFTLPKDALLAKLREHGIEARTVHYPLSTMPAFSRYVAGHDWKARNPNAYRLSENGISLPSGLQLTRENVAYVSRCLREYLAR